MRRLALCSSMVVAVLLSACGASHPQDAGEPDAGCGGGFVYCSPAFGACCADTSYDAVCVDGAWSCDARPEGFGPGPAHLNSECRGDTMGLIGFEGYEVAYASCYATGPIDAGAGDPACGAERPTCSGLLGRCCTGILTPATCTGSAWTCGANQTLTSTCSVELGDVLRGDHGPQRAADFCHASGDAGVGDAAIPDAGALDASSADAGDGG